MVVTAPTPSKTPPVAPPSKVVTPVVTAQRSAELALVKSEQAIVTQHDVLRAERTLAARQGTLRSNVGMLPEETVS